MIVISCNDSIFRSIIYVFKNFLNLIWIIGPILAIISLTINISLMVKNPENKKLINKIRNSVIALFVLFFIPILVNVTVQLVGGDFSKCWNQTNNSLQSNPSNDYSSEKEKKRIFDNPKNYEKGNEKSEDESNRELIKTDSGEKIARFGAQLAGYATGNVSKGGPHWPGWYPNHGSIYLHEGTGGSGKSYPNIGVGYHNYQELPNDLTNLHDFWFTQDMVSRYPATQKNIKLYWNENFAYAGMWPIIFATIRGSYDPSFTHSKKYLDSAVQNGTFIKLTTTFGKLDNVAKPGDLIGGADMGHDWIWIGNDIVKEYWPNAPKTAKMLTASGQEGLWPNIVNSNYGVWKGNVKATIYRPTGKVNITSKNPLVIDLTKYSLTNNQGFDAQESKIRQEYCDKNWPHLGHK